MKVPDLATSQKIYIHKPAKVLNKHRDCQMGRTNRKTLQLSRSHYQKLAICKIYKQKQIRFCVMKKQACSRSLK
ncbi:hypothetical protein AO250_13165 [Pseudomonas syringae pv. actinidiae ICMP 19497]|nr:hypothetical protein AO250_13165 [Pseudomonas syringae pv. actinidiae ICMP 19497]OOK93164.1 hypothetical protein B0B36_29035 [Pseudomonas syringae pv. actinidifoliorum]